MAYLPATKVFEGKTYRLHNDYLKKSQADNTAIMLRGKDWAVRVVRLLGLYGIYKRRL